MLHCKRGTAAIEFAIALIPLVLILSGGITYAGVLAMQLSLDHAANEAARAGLAGLSLCERGSLAGEAAKAALPLGKPAGLETHVEVTAQAITVTLTYPYRTAAILPVLIPVPETLTAKAVALTAGTALPAGSCS